MTAVRKHCDQKRVSYESDDQLVRRRGWYLEESAAAEDVEQAASDVAHVEFSLQMAPRRITSLAIQMTDTRRAMCAGSLARSFFACYTQIPHFAAPGLSR